MEKILKNILTKIICRIISGVDWDILLIIIGNLNLIE